jgi:hypothetical protein
MNAATRMRASWRARCAGGDAWSVGAVLGERVVAVGVWEDAVADMIPIRYVTDRFGILESRTG